jgi:hypothetical protein
MHSRRSFLLSSLGISLGALTLNENWVLPAAARSKGPIPASLRGPHLIAKDEWAPAILPDHLGLVDKGYLCFTDQFGRLSIVDLRKPQNPKTPVKTVAELRGLGHKVADFAICNFAAYGLTIKENDLQEQQYNLTAVSLTPVTNPQVLSETALKKYQEAKLIVANNEFICIAGVSTSKENLVSIYSAPARRAGATPTFIASLSTQTKIKALDLFEKQLTVLSGGANGRKTQIDIINLAGGTAQILSTLTTDGNYQVVARTKEQILIAGQEGTKSSTNYAKAKLIAAGSNPHISSSITLEPILEIDSLAAGKDRFVALGTGGGQRVFLTLGTDKSHSLTQEQVLKLPRSKQDGGKKASVVLKDNVAYIASGWSGVQMLSRNREGFQLTFAYDIPRLAASGLAVWDNMAVLAAGDLQLYSLSKPEHLQLVAKAETDSSIKAMVGAGSFVLCLTKDQATLRKMSNLEETIAQTKLSASQICFDKSQQKAFAIRSQEKTTKIHCLKVFSNSLSLEAPQEIPGLFNHIQALSGFMVLSGLNDLVAYNTTGGEGQLEQTGSRHFENLAIRDIGITEKYILATAIDTNSRGFFLVLARDNKDLKVLGTVNLPHDGLALACQGEKAVAIGKTPDGQDLVSIIDFSFAANPQITASLKAIEGASSVSIKDQMAVLAGRGLALVSLA